MKTKGGASFVTVYEASEDRDWKEQAAKVMLRARGAEPMLEGPVAVTIVAFWPQPSSTRKAERPLRAWRLGKPDADNVAKAVMDAATGVLYADDAQVSDLRVIRVVGRRDELPRLEVVVRPTGPLPAWLQVPVSPSAPSSVAG